MSVRRPRCRWASLVLLGGFLCACEAVVRRNVTVTGVVWERSLLFGGSMNGTVRSARVTGVQGSAGECPAGRYCPAGTSEPVLCPAGFYSSSTRRSTVCPYKCFPNYYCPDPGQLVQCPPNTYSASGGSSQYDCKCNSGYQCTYRRSVNLNVMVGVPYTVWSSPAGAGLRAAVVQAVAESAGVAVGSVSIKKVLPSVAQAPQGGKRRLLGEAGGGGSLISITVEGAERIEGLQGRLERHKHFRGGARVHWKKMEHVRVLPAPPGRAWEWRLFKGRA